MLKEPIFRYAAYALAFGGAGQTIGFIFEKYNREKDRKIRLENFVKKDLESDNPNSKVTIYHPELGKIKKN